MQGFNPATGTELQRWLDACRDASDAPARARATDALIATLSARALTAPSWCEVALVLDRNDAAESARAVLEAAKTRWPDAPEPHLAEAQLCAVRGDAIGTAQALDTGLATIPGEPALALQRARLLRQEARLNAAARCLRQHGRPDWPVDALLDALQLLKQGQREADALAIARKALQHGVRDPRLLASAGNLAMALGDFGAAREDFLAALAAGIDLDVWYVGQALTHCQRYSDAAHPDRARLEALRSRSDLQAAARASLGFGLAKLAEDGGDFATAAREYREANALLRTARPWRPTSWAQDLARSLGRGAAGDALPGDDFRPVFVVGLPRTGTTLVAQRLARHAAVRVRGEPPFLEYIARQLDALGPRADRAALRQAAHFYATQMRQDDAPATWYVDKNPLNLRWLDTVARLFPQARVIVCRRAPRDCALSIWTQFFAEDTYAFSSDFAAIRQVHDDVEILLRHWQAVLPLRFLTVDYARLVEDTAVVDAEMAALLDLPVPTAAEASAPAAITSASLWQARQPVYRHALGRSERFAALLPELRAAFPESELSPPRPPSD